MYYSGAQSIAEGFFEIDLGIVLGLDGVDIGLFALEQAEREHWLLSSLLSLCGGVVVPTTKNHGINKTSKRLANGSVRYYHYHRATG